MPNQPDDEFTTGFSAGWASLHARTAKDASDKVGAILDKMRESTDGNSPAHVKRQATAEACCRASQALYQACQAFASASHSAAEAKDYAVTPVAKRMAVEAGRSASMAAACAEHAATTLRDICASGADYASFALSRLLSN